MGGATRPRLILLDVVGTLLDVRGSVGERYAERAARHGVQVAGDALERAFRESWVAEGSLAAALAGPGGSARAWWRRVVGATFARAGARVADPEALFEDLFAWFATPGPWQLHGDVRPALEAWRAGGIALGVVSNFDERLPGLLEALGLAALLDGITTPADAGAAKPDGAIFRAALARHGVAAGEAWHVGDDAEEDVAAARAAGLHAVWIRRRGDGGAGAVRSLLEIRVPAR